MAQYWLDVPTDPRSDAEVLADWTLINCDSASATHSLTISTASGPRAIRIGRASGTSVAIAEFVPAGDSADVDLIVHMIVESVSSTAPGGLAARSTAVPNQDTANWYGGYSNGASSDIVRHIVDGVPTVLSNASSGVTQSSYHWRRLQITGTTIRQKVWAGNREDEPGAWLHSVTDTNYASGAVGLASRGGSSNQGIIYVQRWAVGTDGDPAPTGPVGGERQRSRLILTPW